MKRFGKFAAIVILFLSLGWEIHSPDFEPLIGIVSSLAAIAGLYGTDDKRGEPPQVRQKNKGKATGYQAGRDINLGKS